MSIKCDVLVVGAGPAGLSAALFLSNKGFSTIVLEKNKNVGPKHTKYDITEGTRIHEILNEVGIKANKISSTSEWISPNHNFVLDSKIEDFYFKRGCDKNSLESKLLKKLKSNNVEIFFETKLISIEKNGKEIIAVKIEKCTNKLRIEPKYVIVADGSNSKFRRKLKVKTNNFVTFIGFGILIESKEGNIIPHAKIYFDEKIAPGGYVYSGSVGKESFFCIVVDAGSSKKKSLKQNLELFLEKQDCEKSTKKTNFTGIGISGIQEVIVGNVLFIGGAALFCNPFLGYGLNYAIESAYYAVDSIGKNNMGTYSKYANEIQKEIKDMFFAREIWRKANNYFFDRLVQAFNGKYDINDEKIKKIVELFGED